MDIDFFKETGDFGQEAPNHGNFTFVTTEAEANYLSILHVHGFLDGLTPSDALTSAERQWNMARPDLPDPWSATPFSSTLTLPVGTELHLSLVNELGVSWGKATLAGQSINAARKAITKYLMAGRYTMAHSGGVALLNHITNAPLRDSLKLAKATDGDLDKPVSGTLCFRAVPVQAAPLPVAPDGKGQTKLSSWQDDVQAFVDQADRALQEVRTQGIFMAGDLYDLDHIRRVLAAIWDIGMIGNIRAYPSIEYKNMGLLDVLQAAFTANPICRFAQGFLSDVVSPAMPAGHFDLDWSLANTDAGKTFAWIQTRKADPYKALADNVKKAPAAYIRLATSVCDLENQMLWERAADGDKNKVLRAEMASAVDWLDKRNGDPPDSAGGAGILLGMLSSIPANIPRPPGLTRLAMYVSLLHALLSAGAVDTRSARESQLTGVVGRMLDLPGTWVEEFRQSSTWSFFLDPGTAKKAATIAVRAPNPGEKAAKTLITQLQEANEATSKQMAERVLQRAEEMERAAQGTKVPADQFVLALAEETEKVQPAIEANAAETLKVEARLARLTKVASVFRVLGFLASTAQLGDDFAKLIVSHKEDDALKLAKDLVSTFGTVARDYFNTRLALDPTLTTAERDSLRASSNGFFVKKIGNGLGVASAVWTIVDAVQKRDPILGGAGACNLLGYGLRMASADFIIWDAGPLVIELSVPLLAVGAALELWANAQPTAPDETFKKQRMNMMRGVVHAMGVWYDRRHKDVPWRSTDVPELESALQKYGQYADMSEQQQKWSVFLTCDLQDAGSMREVLTKIGFSSSEASQLVADESVAKYVARGSWQGLPISQRSWISLE